MIWICALGIVRAGEPPPEANAAFDRHATLVEAQIKTRTASPRHFLWLDDHPDQKSRAWFSQDVIVPLKTLDQDKEIRVPGGLIQHWIGAIFLERATIERVRDVVTGFANYKTVFKEQIAESRLVKRDGDHFEAYLRLYKKQFQTVILNANLSADYSLVDPNRAYLICRSTHIGETLRKKNAPEEERSPEDQYGYLWRMNLYWRFAYADNGVYAEVESITLSREDNGHRLSHVLNGFVQNFPREFVAGLMDGMRQAFPNTR